MTQLLFTLQVAFQSFPTQMQCGEVVKVAVTVANVGPTELRKLHLTCSEPNMVVLPEYTDITDYTAASR